MLDIHKLGAGHFGNVDDVSYVGDIENTDTGIVINSFVVFNYNVFD